MNEALSLSQMGSWKQGAYIKSALSKYFSLLRVKTRNHSNRKTTKRQVCLVPSAIRSEPEFPKQCVLYYLTMNFLLLLPMQKTKIEIQYLSDISAPQSSNMYLSLWPEWLPRSQLSRLLFLDINSLGLEDKSLLSLLAPISASLCLIILSSGGFGESAHHLLEIYILLRWFTYIILSNFSITLQGRYYQLILKTLTLRFKKHIAKS